MRPPRVMLVRQWDSQMGGSGCCGRLGGEDNELGGACGEPSPFGEARLGMEQMGVVYRALRRAFPEPMLTIEVVDPRNTMWLLPALIGDARRRGLRGRQIWDLVRRGVRQHAVILDGLVLHPGGVAPDADRVVAAVREQLATA